MLARWNENMLGIQDSAAIMACIYFSPAKCSRAATKDKTESNRNPLKISTHTDLGGFDNQILPLIIVNSFPFPGALSLSRWEGRFCWPWAASGQAPLLSWGFSSMLCWHQWSSHSPAAGRNPPALPTKTWNLRLQFSYCNVELLVLETTKRDHGSPPGLSCVHCPGPRGAYRGHVSANLSFKTLTKKKAVTTHKS